MALSRWKPHATFSLSAHGSLQRETYCNQCLRHFVSSDALEEHFLESKFHFYCRLCARHFRDPKSLENHHKTSRNHYHCEKCNIAVTSSAQLTEHYVEKHAYCVLCRKLYDNEDKLHDHLAGSHYTCWDCNVFYTTEKELKDHYARLKKHPWCSVCKEAFYDEEAYTRHLTVSKNHYYCVQCKRDHNSAEHLILHFDTNEHKSHKLIKCPYCPRTFDAHSSLVIHFEIGTCAGKNLKKDYKALLPKRDNLEKPMRIINDVDRPVYYLPYHGYPKHTVEYSRHVHEPRRSADSVELVEPVYKYIDSRSMEYVECEPYDYNRGRHSYHERSRSGHRSSKSSRSRSRHSHYVRQRSQSRHRHHHSSDSEDSDWEDVLRQSRLATNLSWNGYKFECAVCFKQFHTLERLNCHLAEDHDSEVYRCAGRNGCGKTFPTIRGLIKHVENDDKCGMGRWRSWRSASVDDLTARFRLIDY
ncbi:hypothetical protein ABW19_dt0204810 [Dactylella cylindrospora]|nr:hypothetical protein ABW19_dt0204810 [Dactylella cylindrospora]